MFEFSRRLVSPRHSTLRGMASRAAPVLTAIGLLFGATDCGNTAVTVGHDQGSATVEVGDTLRVDFGTVSSSIGDSWHLMSGPDDEGNVVAPGDGGKPVAGGEAILSDLGDNYEPQGDPEQDGGYSDMTWEFEAVEAGETTLEFQYCYRSGPPDCRGDDRGDDLSPPEPVRLRVTVQE